MVFIDCSESWIMSLKNARYLLRPTKRIAGLDTECRCDILVLISLLMEWPMLTSPSAWDELSSLLRHKVKEFAGLCKSFCSKCLCPRGMSILQWILLLTFRTISSPWPRRLIHSSYLGKEGLSVSIPERYINHFCYQLDDDAVGKIVPYMVAMFVPGSRYRTGEIRRGTTTLLQDLYLESHDGSCPFSLFFCSFFFVVS
jgi:hypothetical protein